MTLREQIERVVATVDLGRASARKGGRRPEWPYLPVVIHSEGVRVGATRQETIVKRAFATREEAVDYAARVIAFRRSTLAKHLGERRYRALREQYGLPREIEEGSNA
jgi:CRISPR/Cas system endoribonuclease Cas6 (RAMP superfamily)